jgi:MFS family permease
MNVAIGPYQAIIPDFVPKERIGVASGWMAAMQSGGNAVGAIAATVLGNTPKLGFVLALLLVLSGVVTLRHLREIPLQPIEDHKGLRLSRSLLDLFISRAFVYLGFYTLLGYFYFYVRGILHQPYFTDPNTAAGVCVLLFTLVGAAGAGLVAKASDKFDERLIVTIGCTILALGVGALALAHSLALIPICISVAGIGWGVFLCADWAFACRLLPPGSLASTMAIWNIAIIGPQMLAPVVATIVIASMHVIDQASGPRVAFAIACIEMLLGAAWIWRLPKRLLGN